MTMRHRFPATMLALTSALVCTLAWAEVVLLLPPRGQAPEDRLASLGRETRLAVVEMGHQLVTETDGQTALAQVRDGQADDTEELEGLARGTKAGWVLAPVARSAGAGIRLELTAYHAATARTESVSRDVDPAKLQPQVLEMLRVLLREEGVGTGALPWESSAPVAPTPRAEETTPAEGTKPGTRATSDLQPLLGLTVGFSTAVSRPDDATGSAAALQGGLRAGVRLGSPVEVAVGLRSNMAGPKATGLDVSGRYWVEVTDGFRLAPELAPGVFFQGGGAQETAFSLRFTAVGALDVAPDISVEAHVGDVTWVPSSSGTLVLGGATLAGVARF
jgi:hypothetical protein